MKIHYWSFLLNEEGQPIENAEVWVYLAGTTVAADLYASESGSYSSPGEPYQLTFNSYEEGLQNIVTDANGYFEFWIGDASVPNGYTTEQKFKLKWYKAGITEGMIDNINILTYSDGQGFNWRGSWAPSGTEYNEYDLVTNTVNGLVNTFNCTSSHNSSTLTEPGSGANWEVPWDYYSTGNTGFTFLALVDTPNSFNTVGALYNVNGSQTAVQETNVILSEGVDTFSITNGTATIDIAPSSVMDIDMNLTINGGFGTTITSIGQANTLTLNESLTIGDGYSGTLTYSGFGKTLTIEDDCIVNQDLTTDADVIFATLTLSAGQSDVDEISNDGTLSDNSVYAIPTEQAVKTYVDTRIASNDSFLELNDTPSSYTASGALYNVNTDVDGVRETSVILSEGVNTFSFTNGTASLDIATASTVNIDANLTVESDSIINQDLTTDADVGFNSITLSGGATIYEFSTDGTLSDNTNNVVPTEQAVKTYVYTEKLHKIETNTNTSIILTTTDTGKTILVNNASDVTITLPSVVSGDAGIWYKIHKIGTGNLTINGSDSDTVEDGTSVSNTISTETWSNITLFLATETSWKFDGSPLGTWETS